jgi:hypothetical protein
MNPTQLLLPVKPSEAVALADAIFRLLENRAWSVDLRGRLQSALPGLSLERLKPLPFTLAPDPVHQNTYYLAVWSQGELWLLHMAPASAPTSSLFPRPVLIARVRPSGGREIVVNAIPVEPNLETIVSQLHPQLLARTGGTQAIWSVPEGNEDWSSYPRRTSVLPAVRGEAASWKVYAGLLGAGYRDGFVHVLAGLREMPAAEKARAYSRFSFVVSDLGELRPVVEFARGMKAVLEKTFDLELDLREADGVSVEAVETLLDNLRLSNVAVQAVETREWSDALNAVLRARQVGMTVAGEPTALPRMHWKGERWL